MPLSLFGILGIIETLEFMVKMGWRFMTVQSKLASSLKDFRRFFQFTISAANQLLYFGEYPLTDFVKINCDGAWRSIDTLSGVGVICRDHTGVVLASKSLVCNNVSSCFDSEGLALNKEC